MDALHGVTVARPVAGADPPGAGAAAPAPQPLFGEWLVLRQVADPGGHTLHLDLSQTEDITRAVRGALLHHADDPPPAVLSGHAASLHVATAAIGSAPGRPGRSYHWHDAFALELSRTTTSSEWVRS